MPCYVIPTLFLELLEDVSHAGLHAASLLQLKDQFCEVEAQAAGDPAVLPQNKFIGHILLR